jgi:hypothetical protein
MDGVAAPAAGHELQGDPAVEALVEGLVDLAHASGAQPTFHPIGADPLARQSDPPFYLEL